MLVANFLFFLVHCHLSRLIIQAAAVLEGVRDVTVASHLIGDMSGSTIDDPLSDRYGKLGGTVSLLEKDSDDYRMIVNYLEKTYEPVKVGDIVRTGIQLNTYNIFQRMTILQVLCFECLLSRNMELLLTTFFQWNLQHFPATKR